MFAALQRRQPSVANGLQKFAIGARNAIFVGTIIYAI